MTIYFYVPIMSPEMATIVQRWNHHLVAQGRAPCPVISVGDSGFEKALRRRFGEGRLRSVADTDEIWLITHGLTDAPNSGALNLGNARRETHKCYTAARLAAAIEDEGLTKAVRTIRLICCRAGLPGSFNGQPVQPFAQRLKQALAGRGYAAVAVVGYEGDVIADHSEFYAPRQREAGPQHVAGSGLAIRPLRGEYLIQNASFHAKIF